MIPRRNSEGWRYLGPFHLKVEREDHYGDQSTTTTLHFIWSTHWHGEFSITRPWSEQGS
jgi:hypothetical protein